MSFRKQQDLLARLFTDKELRLAFLSQPEKIGAEHGLSAEEIAELSVILPEELDFFAESLFFKRLREVEKLLPLTRKFLGSDFAVKFREFSACYNPQTVKKHLEDSVRFCQFLQNDLNDDVARNIARYEGTKMKFFGYGKRFAFCFLDYDMKEISSGNFQLKEKIRRAKTVAIWCRIRGRTKYFSFSPKIKRFFQF